MRVALIALLLFASPARAAALLDVAVEHEDGRYHLSSEVWFDVPVEQIYGVFLDWDLSTQFSSAIVESRNLAPDADGRSRFYSRNNACVLFFCMSIERYGYVEHEPFEYIHAWADPAKSDVHLSEERWRFREEGGGTIVHYDLEIEPKMWIPPVIGPIAIKHKLKSRGLEALERIEALAKDYRADGG